MLYNVILAASMATTVLGHGLVISPPIRAAGPAMDTACGKSVAALVAEDPTSHVEGMPEAALELGKAFDPVKCNLFLCKGLQFGDNAKNVQTFTPGQKVAIKANITIPHEGPANVSIVDTKTNTMIGTPLLSFSTYADEKLKTLPANNTAFEITIPTTLGDKCAVAGACVVQWFWFGKAADQTYESCIDFTTGAAKAANVVDPAIEPVVPLSKRSAKFSRE